MDKTKPLVIHIYRDMLRRAEILRQKARTDEIVSDLYSSKELWETVSGELYSWVAELERTEEVNPTENK